MKLRWLKYEAKIYELQSAHSSESIKLPSIQLPTFSGIVTEWTRFWDLFETAVPIQKLTYLKGLLAEVAKVLVKGTKVEAANFSECVELLKSTYGRASVIKASHVQTSVNLPTSGYTIAKLTEFRAYFECRLRSLEILYQTFEEVSPLF